MTGMQMAMMGSGSEPVVTVDDANPFAIAFDPDDAIVIYSVNNNRTVTGTGVSINNWLSSDGVASNYDVRATIVSGALDSGTVNTWLDLSSSHQWVVSQTTPGFFECTLTIEIRLRSSGVVKDSGTITLTAEVN